MICSYHRFVLYYTTVHYATLHYVTLHNAALHYRTQCYSTLYSCITVQLQPHYFTLQYNYNYTTSHYTTLCCSKNCNCNYSTQITLNCNCNQCLQLHYTRITTTAALHHATSNSCSELTATTIATIKKKTTPSCHPKFATTSLSYRFPISETSAAAFCGNTGIHIVCIRDPMTPPRATHTHTQQAVRSTCHNQSSVDDFCIKTSFGT